MHWNSAYSVGIEEIDNQHRELLRLFSIVENAIQMKQGWSTVHYGLIEVRAFAKFHFKFEEALMRLYGFPDYAGHGEVHERILKRTEVVEHASLQVDAEDQVMKFFRDWLIDHIQGADRAYARHILAGAPLVTPKQAD
jgi:hemerythrin